MTTISSPALLSSATPTWRPLADVAAMTARELRRTVRSVDMLITSLVIPVSIMLVFVIVFGGAISRDGTYINYVVPGTLILCSGFGSAITAVSVAKDMESGIIDRFRTMPIFGASVLVGHVVASILRNLASIAIVLAVAFALGYRPAATPAGWVLIALYLMLVIASFTWLSCAGGLVLSQEAAGSINFVFLFVPYVSSGFVAADTMPVWLQGFADNQPFTPIIETLRSLLNGTTPTNGWFALAWLVGFLLVSLVASIVLFRRRVAH
jgi:ABC-2 type transport system permease protein